MCVSCEVQTVHLIHSNPLEGCYGCVGKKRLCQQCMNWEVVLECTAQLPCAIQKVPFSGATTSIQETWTRWTSPNCIGLSPQHQSPEYNKSAKQKLKLQKWATTAQVARLVSLKSAHELSPLKAAAVYVTTTAVFASASLSDASDVLPVPEPLPRSFVSVSGRRALRSHSLCNRGLQSSTSY